MLLLETTYLLVLLLVLVVFNNRLREKLQLEFIRVFPYGKLLAEVAELGQVE